MLLEFNMSTLDFRSIDSLPVGFDIIFPSENGIVWISFHVGVHSSSLGCADTSTYVASWAVPASMGV